MFKKILKNIIISTFISLFFNFIFFIFSFFLFLVLIIVFFDWIINFLAGIVWNSQEVHKSLNTKDNIIKATGITDFFNQVFQDKINKNSYLYNDQIYLFTYWWNKYYILSRKELNYSLFWYFYNIKVTPTELSKQFLFDINLEEYIKKGRTFCKQLDINLNEKSCSDIVETYYFPLLQIFNPTLLSLQIQNTDKNAWLTKTNIINSIEYYYKNKNLLDFSLSKILRNIYDKIVLKNPNNVIINANFWYTFPVDNQYGCLANYFTNSGIKYLSRFKVSNSCYQNSLIGLSFDNFEGYGFLHSGFDIKTGYNFIPNPFLGWWYYLGTFNIKDKHYISLLLSNVWSPFYYYEIPASFLNQKTKEIFSLKNDLESEITSCIDDTFGEIKKYALEKLGLYYTGSDKKRQKIPYIIKFLNIFTIYYLNNEWLFVDKLTKKDFCKLVNQAYLIKEQNLDISSIWWKYSRYKNNLSKKDYEIITKYFIQNLEDYVITLYTNDNYLSNFRKFKKKKFLHLILWTFHDPGLKILDNYISNHLKKYLLISTKSKINFQVVIDFFEKIKKLKNNNLYCLYNEEISKLKKEIQNTDNINTLKKIYKNKILKLVNINNNLINPILNNNVINSGKFKQPNKGANVGAGAVAGFNNINLDNINSNNINLNENQNNLLDKIQNIWINNFYNNPNINWQKDTINEIKTKLLKFLDNSVISKVNNIFCDHLNNLKIPVYNSIYNNLESLNSFNFKNLKKKNYSINKLIEIENNISKLPNSIFPYIKYGDIYLQWNDLGVSKWPHMHLMLIPYFTDNQYIENDDLEMLANKLFGTNEKIKNLIDIYKNKINNIFKRINILNDLNLISEISYKESLINNYNFFDFLWNYNEIYKNTEKINQLLSKINVATLKEIISDINKIINWLKKDIDNNINFNKDIDVKSFFYNIYNIQEIKIKNIFLHLLGKEYIIKLHWMIDIIYTPYLNNYNNFIVNYKNLDDAIFDVWLDYKDLVKEKIKKNYKDIVINNFFVKNGRYLNCIAETEKIFWWNDLFDIDNNADYKNFLNNKYNAFQCFRNKKTKKSDIYPFMFTKVGNYLLYYYWWWNVFSYVSSWSRYSTISSKDSVFLSIYPFLYYYISDLEVDFTKLGKTFVKDIFDSKYWKDRYYIWNVDLDNLVELLNINYQKNKEKVLKYYYENLYMLTFIVSPEYVNKIRFKGFILPYSNIIANSNIYKNLINKYIHFETNIDDIIDEELKAYWIKNKEIYKKIIKENYNKQICNWYWFDKPNFINEDKFNFYFNRILQILQNNNKLELYNNKLPLLILNNDIRIFLDYNFNWKILKIYYLKKVKPPEFNNYILVPYKKIEYYLKNWKIEKNNEVTEQDIILKDLNDILLHSQYYNKYYYFSLYSVIYNKIKNVENLEDIKQSLKNILLKQWPFCELYWYNNINLDKYKISDIFIPISHLNFPITVAWHIYYQNNAERLYYDIKKDLLDRYNIDQYKFLFILAWWFKESWIHDGNYGKHWLACYKDNKTLLPKFKCEFLIKKFIETGYIENNIYLRPNEAVYPKHIEIHINKNILEVYTKSGNSKLCYFKFDWHNIKIINKKYCGSGSSRNNEPLFYLLIPKNYYPKNYIEPGNIYNSNTFIAKRNVNWIWYAGVWQWSLISFYDPSSVYWHDDERKKWFYDWIKIWYKITPGKLYVHTATWHIKKWQPSIADKNFDLKNNYRDENIKILVERYLWQGNSAKEYYNSIIKIFKTFLIDYKQANWLLQISNKDIVDYLIILLQKYEKEHSSLNNFDLKTYIKNILENQTILR